MLQLPNQVAVSSFVLGLFVFGFFFFFIKVPKISGSVTIEFFSPYHYIFGNAINKSKPGLIMTRSRSALQ